MQRFFGIVVSAALVVSSGMTGVFAADPGHSHDDGKPISIDPDPAYTITLTHPDEKATFDGTNSHYGAYQIFSGTVNKTPSDSAISNPGSDPETHIPITDIKWGNAFGITEEMDPDDKDTANRVDLTERQTNIIGFVYALAKASTGSYSYAFNDFKDFNDLFDGNKLAAAYVNGGGDVTVTTDGNDRVTNVTNPGFVNYDKLAVHIADVLVKPENIDDHEWLQAFNDILGGYAQNPAGGYLNKGYVNRFYEGTVTADSKSYEIKVPAGYYMIRDLSGFEGEQSKSYSARMLFVANNVTQILKEDVPELDKEILRGDAAVGSAGNQTEVAGVGDVVHFQLKGTLPSNYELYLGGYQYIFEDTLSKGLDLVEYSTHNAYNESSGTYVNVTVKGLYEWDDTNKKWNWNQNAYANIPVTVFKHDVSDEHPSDKHLAGDVQNYSTTYGDHKLTVKFPCLREIRIEGTGSGTTIGKVYRLGYEGEDDSSTSTINSSKIYVDYYAKVNENAVVSPKSSTGDNGNFNQAQIVYSDNPQSYADTDTTTIDNATVYIFGLDIVKVDAAQYLRDNGLINNCALEGVKFAVVRKKVGTTGAETEWEIAKFKTIASADIDPTENLPDNFKNFGYYSITTWESIQENGEAVKSENFDAKYLENYMDDAYNIKTLKDGVLNISGLDVGVQYTIAETAPPTATENYAKINPFTIELTATKDDSNEYTGKLSNAESPQNILANTSFSFDNPVDIPADQFTGGAEDNGSANMLVANFKYIDLPSTGGVGTVWFYILGGGVLALSGVLFFLSKKKPTK